MNGSVARTMLVIIWHLLADPAARYHELGAAYHASRTDKDRKARNHVRQLEALGFTVTLAQAGWPPLGLGGVTADTLGIQAVYILGGVLLLLAGAIGLAGLRTIKGLRPSSGTHGSK